MSKAQNMDEVLGKLQAMVREVQRGIEIAVELEEDRKPRVAFSLVACQNRKPYFKHNRRVACAGCYFSRDIEGGTEFLAQATALEAILTEHWKPDPDSAMCACAVCEGNRQSARQEVRRAEPEPPWTVRSQAEHLRDYAKRTTLAAEVRRADAVPEPGFEAWLTVNGAHERDKARERDALVTNAELRKEER